MAGLRAVLFASASPTAGGGVWPILYCLYCFCSFVTSTAVMSLMNDDISHTIVMFAREPFSPIKENWCKTSVTSANKVSKYDTFLP